ncbi:MAG: polyhydroxyalkanoate synthesis repressor PhaR [Rhodobacteraceae bacterium]|nr:polyhydroxyalkanoate synthesis repressor PhaR [Paracoccaceae bacterium]
MSEKAKPLVIKKYASRRLYNKETSEYVTLDEISRIIRAGREVRIVDGKTKEDLTRQYLFQIIADLESKGEPAFPVDMLTEVVRAYGETTGKMLPWFLEESFRQYRRNQEQLLAGFQSFNSPVDALQAIRKQNERYLSSWMSFWSSQRAGESSEEAPSEGRETASELGKSEDR